MSSTNRGGQRSEADNYPTPKWPVHRLLEKCHLPGGLWLEPGGGEGNIVRAVNEQRTDVTWWSAELRETCREPLVAAVGDPDRVLIGDYLDPGLFPKGLRFDVALGNPPFRYAMEFIERSFELADCVALLLRTNFIGSEERSAWMQEFPPDLYHLPNRPSFRGSGSDSIEYAWFVWEAGRTQRVYGLHRVLDATPLEERQFGRLPKLGPVEKKAERLAKKALAAAEAMVAQQTAVENAELVQEHVEDPT